MRSRDRYRYTAFSRRNSDRSDISKFFPTFAYQLSGFIPSINKLMEDALARYLRLMSARRT